jgi:hypothetical protein
MAKNKTEPKQDWRSAFIANFPQYAKLVDGGPGEQEARSKFGDDLVDLIQDVAKRPKQYDFTTQAGVDAFNAKVRATKYFNETVESAKAFDAMLEVDRADKIRANRITIANGYGDLGLTSKELDDITVTATRRGLTGLALSQYINSIVGTRARGEQDLLDSLDAQALKKVAADYGYNPPDLNKQILASIQGKEYNGEAITVDTFKKKGLALAKGAHFQLAPQLDAGLTLAEIFSSYRDTAANILELSPESVSFSDPKFRTAFGGPNTPPPTLGEWETMLRTDPKYGFENTKRAKRDAFKLSTTIAKMFGEVL